MRLTLTLERLPDLREALRRLPTELKLEAASRVVAAADQAAALARAAYPDHGTGNLRRGVGVQAVPASSAYGARMRVRSRAPHAWLYERGSKVRQTKKGWNRGRMTAFDVFIPIMQDRRRILEDELRDIVRTAGFEVRG